MEKYGFLFNEQYIQLLDFFMQRADKVGDQK